MRRCCGLAHLPIDDVHVRRAISISSKTRRGLSDWLRLVRNALTTSDRDRWNRVDIINNRKYAWAHRNRFQQRNDVFHSAGKRGRTLSYEMVTLQFRGVEWSYMLIPALLALVIIALITAVGWQSRREKCENALKEWTVRAEQLSAMRSERESTPELTLEESEAEN